MRFLPAIAWAVLIFTASSIPSNAIPSLILKVSDLLIHFIVYAVFGSLLALAFVESTNRVSRKLILIVCCIGILYGASDEFHQTFVQGRVATVSDFLADSAGIIFGLALFSITPRFLKLLKWGKY